MTLPLDEPTFEARYAFNDAAFALFVATPVQHRKLRLADASAEAGVSKAALFRAWHRQGINTANFLSLCLWLKINPFCFLLDRATGRTLAPMPAATVSHETSGETAGNGQ